MENQKLNRGAEQYPSMDDAGNAPDMDENPQTEKPAGAAELMTPGVSTGRRRGPDPEDNEPETKPAAMPGNGMSVADFGGNPNDVRMKGEQPYSSTSNFGEGGSAGDIGQSDTGSSQ